ncbi:chlorophyll synthesis pathway protein BchC [Roseisolibacter sp. H3M3-2]|uniref:chlorophyll synthesis pathway protein BchC n=1 Tax=Roseisolibacter sp. H3M3-2 TaxID=3031323 RepID=UPI0023DA586B|nr:chlorophyll synthesis pathway protein BchC [Roseisolibacter sp. H3M3-2]MDF1503552.1 chlorophyll synthesis pathway protein BchC [Roseisolibacter sp. H3M3-2]
MSATLAARPTAEWAPPATARAVVLDAPGRIALRELTLAQPGDADVVVDVEWTGISTGTERLLWAGTMPHFPGMGYPLVPGYESVGRVRWAGAASGREVGERVFLPGAHALVGVRNLFGGAADTLVAPGARARPVGEALGAEAMLLSLAATARHCVGDGVLPDLVVGHGALGRLVARLVLALGGPAPTVWEVEPRRVAGADGYEVLHPDADPRRDYRCVCEVSGANGLLDALVGRLARGGEIVIGGFYTEPLAFAYVPAFLRGARFRVAAEFTPDDLADARALMLGGRLSLDGLLTHRAAVRDEASVAAAYATAFGDPSCLKMVLDWRPDA